MKHYARFYYGFTMHGNRHYQMDFRCGETIDCRPPYIEGKMDCVWVSLPGPLPKATDKDAIRRLAGMKILPIERAAS
jgi:hypothetical protein